MRLIGLMSHFDESPIMLAATIASGAKIGIDHWVCVDGAYMLMPDGRGASHIEAQRAITDTCEALGVGLTTHTLPQRQKWSGNEVAKRNATLELGLVVAEPDVDWFIVLDADMVVGTVRDDIHHRLDDTVLDVASYSMTDRIDPLRGEQDAFVAKCAGGHESRTPIRAILRARPGLHYESNHYTIVSGDGEILNPASPVSVPALNLESVITIEHRQRLRDEYRDGKRLAYYQARDMAQIEKPIDLDAMVAA